jgi:hypothetical protein
MTVRTGGAIWSLAINVCCQNLMLLTSLSGAQGYKPTKAVAACMGVSNCTTGS